MISVKNHHMPPTIYNMQKESKASSLSIIGPPCPARLVYSSLCRFPPHDDQREKPPHAADDTRRHRPGIDVRTLLHQRTAVRRLVLQVQVSK